MTDGPREPRTCRREKGATDGAKQQLPSPEDEEDCGLRPAESPPMKGDSRPVRLLVSGAQRVLLSVRSVSRLRRRHQLQLPRAPLVTMDPGRRVVLQEAENLFGEEHVRRYRETGGEVGQIWREGSTVLLLTTTGRTSGELRTTPLIYAEDGDRYVIVASKGGAPEHPGWYRNLTKTPNVELQVGNEVFPAQARTASGEERERLWPKANEVWPHYDEYASKTDREIPVVVLERI